MQYDLEERTEKFAKDIVSLVQKAPSGATTTPILSQMVRAGTSVGANYCEANGASSKKDFKNKIYICKKEAKETMYWLRVLAHAQASLTDDCQRLWNEAQQLTLIFSRIISTMEKGRAESH